MSIFIFVATKKSGKIAIIQGAQRGIEVIILESILMGVFATVVMDFLAGFLAKKKIIYPFISPEAIGRWFLYMFRGKFTHKDINTSQPLKNEKFWCLVSHYLIGIVLAGIYLFVELHVTLVRDHVWFPLVFGIATVFLPWCWLLPSIGLGFMASKSPNRHLVIRTNLANHTNFGLGLFVWVIVFHRFFT